MARKGLNGQKLARLSQVSDSEISRILQGKSRPGLDNALRLAKAVGRLARLPGRRRARRRTARTRPTRSRPRSGRSSTSCQKIGCPEVLTILENVRFLGYEVAMSRLVGAKPVIEIDKETSDARRSSAPARASPAADLAAAELGRIGLIRSRLEALASLTQAAVVDRLRRTVPSRSGAIRTACAGGWTGCSGPGGTW